MASKKKTSPGKTILVAIIALVLGFLIGYLGSNVFSSNELEFVVVGKMNTNVAQGSEYKEQGATCVFKGVDYSNNLTITYYDNNKNVVTNITTEELTTFIVEYKISNDELVSSIYRIVKIVEFDDLEINVMMLGNSSSGDSIYIKAGETDILVDAGSRKNSAPVIKEYLFDSTSNLHSYVSDSKLEYVIVTHADQDHIAAFVGPDGIFNDNNIEIDNIIQFSKTNKNTNLYQEYLEAVEARKANGTNVYTALDYSNGNDANGVIEIAAGIEIEILYNYYYDHECKNNENNYSVCFMLRRGDIQYLFTGDLENENGDAEDKLVQNNDLGEVYFYKMGHHGSKTSSTMNLLNVIKPEVVVATCVAFNPNDYNYASSDAYFPTKIAIDNLNSLGTVKHLYVPAMYSENEKGYEPANGNIVLKANGNGTYIECSHSNEDFYTFDIFKQYRTWTVK